MSKHLKLHVGLPAKVLVIAICTVTVFVLFCTWNSTRAGALQLVSEQQIVSSGIYAEWAKGNVMILIRHAERCDHSHNTCLNDPAGITVVGSQVATEAGKGFQSLGLNKAHLLSSPEVRAQQTARFMFGMAIPVQDWLNQCDGSFASNAFSHKQPGHNLVLITHSSCIEQLEQTLQVRDSERSSAYASALFLAMDNSGKARVLGQINADNLRNLVTHSGN
ncbi:histidine phosphatase family protein [Pseudomonas alkylphenolica]|uniref:lipopolysaccharide core heptose(II)-phosphate phosphatase PmrG n=1 Tax=Pseudomonas alkylphenolica TaxID=237609 RepID=UPI0027BB14A1|nr:histidine phosphatase family protein [Pseudomonas alkylphenolica]